LSPIAKVLEKALLPHITAEIPNNPAQHGFKSNHSTVTALNNITNSIVEGFNQKPPARTVLVSLDMSKAFDTVNQHTLCQKILNLTTINPTITKYLSNYLKGRKTYTIYQNTPSKKHHLKTGVPQGSVLSPILFNLYTSDLPPPPPNTQLGAYADDLNTLATHPKHQTAQARLQPYLDQIYTWTIENNLQLNPDKSTATLFSPDTKEHSTQLQLTINGTTIPTIANPKILGVTFDPLLKFHTHCSKIAEKAKTTINILKSLTTTKWGKSKETISSTYKAITRPILEYASPTWSTLISDTSLTKLSTIQHSALRIATGCTSDTNTKHLHNETKILPIANHLKLHASNFRQKANHPDHPNHNLIAPRHTRNMKTTLFLDTSDLYTRPTPNQNTPEEITNNIKTNHTIAVQNYLTSLSPSKLTNQPYTDPHPSEETLPRSTRTLLSQLRINKSPFLLSYKHHCWPLQYPSPLCPLCNTANHDTLHLFTCHMVPTTLSVTDLWTSPCLVAELLETWESKLDPFPRNG